MDQYINALNYILKYGKTRTDRTGVGTIGIFGHQMRFDLEHGFPTVTTKKLAWKPVVSELLWFLEGSTDERRLAEIIHGTRDISKKTIWTANADSQGVALGYTNTDSVKELGPIYGKQWRNSNGVDQIANIIHQLKTTPDSRRIILNSWDVNEINMMALPPCHTLIQFYVQDNKLSCQLYQRSADMFLGVPFNIASYALLTHMLAQITDLEVGEFVHTFGDAHIYLNHMDQVLEQVSRKPKLLPTLSMPDFKTLDELLKCKVEDFALNSYEHGAAINAPMAI